MNELDLTINKEILEEKYNIEKEFEKYKTGRFDNDQLTEIHKGLEFGLKDKVAVYAKEDIPAKEMAYLRKYLTLEKENREVKKETVSIDVKQEDEKVEEMIYQEKKKRIELAYISLAFFLISLALSAFALYIRQ